MTQLSQRIDVHDLGGVSSLDASSSALNLMAAQFPSGLTLTETRAAMRGVFLDLASGLAELGKPSLPPFTYQVVNMTMDAVIVAPLIRKLSYGEPEIEPNVRRKVSVLIETGMSRHRYPRDVVHFMHPIQLSLLHGLLGLSNEQAWRRWTQ